MNENNKTMNRIEITKKEDEKEIRKIMAIIITYDDEVMV